ncbi:MAG: glycosyltransferase family 2 protein [Patescibacteria group bacterium]|nr:glycosyltransferase family 2 protein [Patescibacteria group bacterium]
MEKSLAIIISPNYKDYAKKYLLECIESIRAQDYAGEIKIFLTDNETSMESVEFIRKIAPELELILNNTNDGFAKGNNDCMREALRQGYEYIVLFNMDTVVDQSCVSEMVSAIEFDDKIGVVQARVMLYDNKEKVNSLGNISHFLGFGYSIAYRDEYRERSDLSRIHYPSGVAIIFKREVLECIGLFDETYWMYNEDQEIGWRAWLAGYRVVLAPKAVIYHKYEFAKSIKQFYYMDRNRILAILQCYKVATLILIFPVFVIMEIGLILFSLKSGWFKEKMRVWAYFFSIGNWQYIIRARKRNQNLRRVSDRKIAKLMSGKIWYQEVDDWKLRFINPFFNFYWKMCQKVMFW